MPKQMPGMYACANPKYPQVVVGEFTICRQDEANVWIQNDDGEGAEFPDELFGDAVREFFSKHF